MNNRTKLFIPAGFFVVMLGLLFYGLWQDPSKVPSALIDRPLPEFSKPDLFDAAGTVSTEDLKGKVSIVNVWATWCPPCYAEHPYLEEIAEREKNLTFVGVLYKDDPQAARDYLKERGNPFKISLVDRDGKLGIDLGVAGPPETFIVDSTGMIRYKHIGAIDNEIWDRVFVPLLKQIK